MLLFEMITVFGIAILNEKVVRLVTRALVAVWGFYQYLKENKNNPLFDSRLIENEENRLVHSKWSITIRKLITILIYNLCIIKLIEISNRSVWTDMVNQVTKNSSIWNELGALRLLNLELIIAMITAILINFITIFLYQIKRDDLLMNSVSKSIFFIIYIVVAIILLAVNVPQFCWMFN